MRVKTLRGRQRVNLESGRMATRAVLIRSPAFGADPSLIRTALSRVEQERFCLVSVERSSSANSEDSKEAFIQSLAFRHHLSTIRMNEVYERSGDQLILRVTREFQEAGIDRLHHPILDEGDTLAGIVQQQSTSFIN